jgi:hypothetical protein
MRGELVKCEELQVCFKVLFHIEFSREDPLINHCFSQTPGQWFGNPEKIEDKL